MSASVQPPGPVGFVGLGIMGAPMARNLLKAGVGLVIQSRTRGPVDELVAAGARAAASPADVARECGEIVLMLPDTAAVEAVVGAMLGSLRRDALVIDMGTTDPGSTRGLASRVRAAGARYLDAPVSGGQGGATAGTLSIMVGGDAADVERAAPIFRAVGSRVTHVGDVGAGQVTKALNQLVVLATIEVVAEALVLAAKSGVSPAKVREALLGGFAQSKILEAHGERMLRHDFAPGARAKIHTKDVEALGRLARENGVPLPAFEAAARQLASLLERGGADLDHSALVMELERAAGVDLSRASPQRDRT